VVESSFTMPIETQCQGCGKRLRVADEHAGKLAKCPQCQAVYTVPQSAVATAWGAGTASDSPLAPTDRWHLKTPDGLTFGPVARAELDRWLSEGRVTSQSQILHEGAGQWSWAAQIYPHLQNAASDSPFQPGAVQPYLPPGVNLYAPSPSIASPYGYSPFRERHRGGAILTMAIVGLVLCQFLAIAAVIMAAVDLGKMKQGVMDPAGKGLTIAGLVIGSLAIALVLFQIVMVVVANM
jgi:hypothetical protein